MIHPLAQTVKMKMLPIIKIIPDVHKNRRLGREVNRDETPPSERITLSIHANLIVGAARFRRPNSKALSIKIQSLLRPIPSTRVTQ